jgi:hypothetical protein
MRPESFRLGSSLCVAAVLVAAATVGCASRSHRYDDRYERGRQERRQYDRIRDRDHGDYHSWNDREDRAYRRFLAERRRAYRDFLRLNDREQREYWSWRHSHLDDDRYRP